MAFTTTQQAQIRMYLGYPDLFRYKDTRLEGIITGTNFSAEAESLVTDILNQLVALDARLAGSGGVVGSAVAKAGVKKLDEIEFFQGQNITDLRKIGRQLATRLSNMLGVPFYGDAFGEGGYIGDSYSAGGLGRANSGRNVIPLG